jgi:DNA adenine methylase
MPYSGGKQRQAVAIAATFPPHGHYVELFAGALSVLLAKPPAPVETINDLNHHVITFWRVLRDRPQDLERACALTPHSRAEHLTARQLDTPDLDEVEVARRVWVQLTQTRGAQLGTSSGWRHTTNPHQMTVSRYLDGYLTRIPPAATRLRHVSLENRPALDLIALHDGPETLFYADPPYLSAVRYGPQYAHEMGDEHEHETLLAALLATDGHVAISGYDHPLYHDHLTGWETHHYPATTMTGTPRTEVLWTSYHQPALFPIPTTSTRQGALT